MRGHVYYTPVRLTTSSTTCPFLRSFEEVGRREVVVTVRDRE